MTILSFNLFAQNLDRVRLHQEMNFITDDKTQNNQNTQSNQSNQTSQEVSKNEPAPEAQIDIPGDLENRYFQDSTQTRQAAPLKKRQK